MPETPKPLSTIFAEARKSLADDSWIDEITLPDEDGEPDDYAWRVVPLESALEAIDRIEAAAERERNAHTNDIHDALYMATGIPGNAAAMREALTRIVEWADRYIGRLCFHGPSPEKDGWRTASHAANDALAQARAALSAPARNCDRFADPGKAWLAYKAECDKNETVPNMIGAISWLFARAEGKAAENA